MPKIYQPDNKPYALSRANASVDTSGIRALGNAASNVLSLIQSSQDDRLSVDLAEFEKEQIKLNADMQQLGRYSTEDGQDYFGDAPVEGGLIKERMRLFNEGASKLKATYGDRVSGELSNYEVKVFSGVTSTYNQMRSMANADYFESYTGQLTESVRTGAINVEDARIGADRVAGILPMDATARNSLVNNANDFLTLSEHEFDMNENPSAAIQKYNTGAYLGSEKVRGAIGSNIGKYIHGEALKEINAANQASAVAMRHKPNTAIIGYAEQFGDYDTVAAVVAAQTKAALIDNLTSGDQSAANNKVSEMQKSAILSQDPMALALANEAAGAVKNKQDMIRLSPRTALLNEGVETDPADLSSMTAYVDGQRDVSARARQQFNLEPMFLGDTAPAFVQMLESVTPDERAGIVLDFARNINTDEKRLAAQELAATNPNVGVALSLMPENAAASPALVNNRAELAAAIMTPADKDYLPKQKEKSAFWSEFERDYEFGDPAVKQMVDKAADSAYTYFAKKRGVDVVGGMDTELYKEMVESIAGNTIKFGAGKTSNFQLPNGEWADPEIAVDSLNTAIETGAMLNAVDAQGYPIQSDDIIDNGRLVPAGDNGKYFIVQRFADGSTMYFADSERNRVVVDMNEIYGKYKSESNLDKAANFLSNLYQTNGAAM